MNAALHIAVAKEFDKTLNSREAAAKLIDMMRAGALSEIELDFSDVEFMSRSFADEYIKGATAVVKQLNASISLLNANEEILRIIRAVSETQNKTERDYQKFSVVSYSDFKVLSDYMLSI